MFVRRVDPTESSYLILREGTRPGRATEAQEVAVTSDTLPEWCDRYAGLSADPIADLESVVLKLSDLARSVD
jgi:hypothetical protein